VTIDPIRHARGACIELALALSSPPQPTTGVMVLGMHRSGTSVLTRIVNLLGVPVGNEPDLVVPDEANAKGYWESLSLTLYQESLLERLGGRWDAPPLLVPGWERSTGLMFEVGRARRVFRRIYGGLPVWTWKDPRTSITLPFWRRAIRPRVLAVVIHRHPLEVARSLAARDGLGKLHALDLWEHYNRALLANTAGLPAFFVSYERVLDDPVIVAGQIHAFLRAHGMTLRSVPQEEVGAFVDAALRHAAVDMAELDRDPDVSIAQRSLGQLLHSLDGPHESLDPSLPGARQLA
jgi:hypothetical protein